MKKNQRIGILTLVASDNCGSLLQTYALQKKLISLGYEKVEVIDFQSENSKRIYDIFPKNIFIQPRKFLFSILKYKRLKKQKNDYDYFRKTALKMSKKKYKNEKEIKNLETDYDVIVCGSDQIWNVCMFDFDKVFFLPNINKVKKIAYAVSLGGQSLKEYEAQSELQSWINDFSKISVREKQGKNDVSTLYTGEVEVLLDPTLLVSKQHWMQLAGNERIVEGKYIFYYSWCYNDKELIKVVKDIMEKTGLPVYVINASKWLFYSYNTYGFNLCEKGGPYTFLNLIYYAELILVESLHGVIFSTIFEKKFWYLNSCRNGDIDQRNSYFLKLLGVENRIIDLESEIDINEIMKDIIYEKKNQEIMQELRKKSISWLEEALG